MSFDSEQHEAGFAQFLVEPGKRRFLELLKLGAKRRRDAVALLDHAVQLDPRFSRQLIGADTTKSGLIALLANQGAAAECYLMSSMKKSDQKLCRTDEGVELLLATSGGVFLSLLPGQLGIFKYEVGNPLLLMRSQSQRPGPARS